MKEDKRVLHRDWLGHPCTIKLISQLEEIRKGFRDEWESGAYDPLEAKLAGETSGEIRNLLDSVKDGDFFGVVPETFESDLEVEDDEEAEEDDFLGYDESEDEE